MNNYNKETARKLLIYYFHLLARKAGVINWNDDCDAEVGEIIDCIFNEIKGSIADHNQAETSHKT